MRLRFLLYAALVLALLVAAELGNVAIYIGLLFAVGAAAVAP